jgi:hypothetical protein
MPVEVLPPAAPTDTPTPVPADTPTPTNMPLPTSTAAPSPTPQPEATEAPTPTPTATSGARVAPPAALANQLPFENPGDALPCSLTFEGKQSGCKPQQFPTLFRIDLGDWTSNPVDVQVDGKKVPGPKDSLVDFVSEPGGYGPGTHKVTVTDTVTKQSATLQLEVQRASSPHILVYPRRPVAGSNVKVSLGGFMPNADVPLGMYREQNPCKSYPDSGRPNECFALLRDLGTTQTNADGSASRSVTIPANAVSADQGSATFLISSPGLRIRPQNTANDLRGLGLPWFVVTSPN